MKTKFYWYSCQMDRQSGHSIFNHPLDGELKVTTITEEKRPGSLFGDEKLVYSGTLAFAKSNIKWSAPQEDWS